MANESKFSAVKNFPKRAQNTHRLKDWRCIRQMFQHFQFSMKNFCKFIIVWFCLFVGFSIVRYFLNVFCCCMCVSTHLIYSFYLVRSYQNWHIPIPFKSNSTCQQVFFSNVFIPFVSFCCFSFIFSFSCNGLSQFLVVFTVFQRAFQINWEEDCFELDLNVL